MQGDFFGTNPKMVGKNFWVRQILLLQMSTFWHIILKSNRFPLIITPTLHKNFFEKSAVQGRGLIEKKYGTPLA